MDETDLPFPRETSSASSKNVTQTQILLKQRYVISDTVLGTGGFATVYKGLDKDKCRNVAVKVYNTESGIDDCLELFERSIQVFQALFGEHKHMKKGVSSEGVADAVALDLAAFEEGLRAQWVGGRSRSKMSTDSAGIASYEAEGLLDLMDVRCCFVELLDFSCDEEGNPGVDPNAGLVYLIFEVGDASLHDELQRYDETKEDMSREDFRAIHWALVSIVWGLHSIGYVHLDIKPQNVMRFGTGSSTQWKLIDLDGAMPSGSTQPLKGLSYTPEYMPPEIAAACLNEARTSGKKPTTIVMSRLMDVWSVGMCALEAIFLQPVLVPFYRDWHKETGSEEKFYDWLSDIQGEPIISGSMLDHLRNIDNDMAELLAGMLVRDPYSRYSIGRCLAHKWFEPTRERVMKDIQDGLGLAATPVRIDRRAKACTAM